MRRKGWQKEYSNVRWRKVCKSKKKTGNCSINKFVVQHLVSLLFLLKCRTFYVHWFWPFLNFCILASTPSNTSKHRSFANLINKIMLTNCSHLAIHLYHFAYLTVDVTFVVQKIEQLKPLSGPYNMNVSHTQLFLYIIHVQIS